MDLARPRGLLDPLGTIDQRAAAGFEAKPVERLLAKRGGDAFAEVGRDLDRACLEGAGQCTLELALGIGLVLRLAADPDPGAAARRPGADVGRDLAGRAKGEPDQLLTRRRPPGEDAAALRNVRV